MPVLEPAALINNRVQAIIAAHDRASILKAELDISGGIDSAVMACLLVDALGPENVILVHSGMSTNPEQTARAQALCDALEAPMINIDLSDVYEQLVSLAHAAIISAHNTETSNAVRDRCKADKTILGSIRSTLRAPVGRAFNRLLGGGLRHGTGNECEDRFLRFYQKGGDGEVDSNPLAMLSKSEVYQLAFALGQKFDASFDNQKVSQALRTIIDAVPSPDLWGEGDGHSDEDELLAWTGAPFTYGRINAETGEITSIGTIERVSRFLDTPYPGTVFHVTCGDLLFSDDLETERLGELCEIALTLPCFNALRVNRSEGTPNLTKITTLLRVARKAERITRHKENPNCPSYGDRASLIAAGILTDELPRL